MKIVVSETVWKYTEYSRSHLSMQAISEVIKRLKAHVARTDGYHSLFTTAGGRSGPTMPLSRRSVETYPETNSHATCLETFGHSRLGPLSHCGLILE